MWEDPEKRDQIIKSRYDRDHYQKAGKKMKENWSDPEYRDRMMKSREEKKDD